MVNHSNRKPPVLHYVTGHIRKVDGKTYKVRKFIRGSGKPAETRKNVSFMHTPNKPIDLDTKFPSVKAWTIEFEYNTPDSDGNRLDDGESVVVFSNNYADAIDEAFENRVKQDKIPISVSAIDPDLGAALKWVTGGGDRTGLASKFQNLAQGAGSALNKVADATGKTASAVGRASTKVGESTAFQTVKGKVLENAGASLSKRGGFFSTLVGEHLTGKSRKVMSELQSKKARKYLQLCYNGKTEAIRTHNKFLLKSNYPDVWAATDFSRETSVTKNISIQRDETVKTRAEKQLMDYKKKKRELLEQQKRDGLVNKQEIKITHDKDGKTLTASENWELERKQSGRRQV